MSLTENTVHDKIFVLNHTEFNVSSSMMTAIEVSSSTASEKDVHTVRTSTRKTSKSGKRTRMMVASLLSAFSGWGVGGGYIPKCGQTHM